MANNKGVKSTRSSGTVHTPRGVNQGEVLIDSNSGLPISVIEDTVGNKRLAVDANISAQDIQINVDLDFVEDGVHIGDPVSGDILKVESDGSINVNTEVDALDGDNVSISAHPVTDQIFDESAFSIITASNVEIYSFTSVNNDTRILHIECTAQTSSTFQLKINGAVKRELRSSPDKRNVIFEFKEHRALLSGDTITIDAEVDRFIGNKAPYRTFTALEGYLA